MPDGLMDLRQVMGGQPEQHDHEANAHERVESVAERWRAEWPAGGIPVIGAAHGLERPRQEMIKHEQAENSDPDRHANWQWHAAHRPGREQRNQGKDPQQRQHGPQDGNERQREPRAESRMETRRPV